MSLLLLLQGAGAAGVVVPVAPLADTGAPRGHPFTVESLLRVREWRERLDDEETAVALAAILSL